MRKNGRRDYWSGVEKNGSEGLILEVVARGDKCRWVWSTTSDDDANIWSWQPRPGNNKQ